MSHPLYDILALLDREHIWYRLARTTDDGVLVMATFVGMRVEIEVKADGSVEVSTFRGDEDVECGFDVVRRIVADDRRENDMAELQLRAPREGDAGSDAAEARRSAWRRGG